MTEDEQRFWDAVFEASIPMADQVLRPTFGNAIAEYAALVADKALDLRRERQKTSTSA